MRAVEAEYSLLRSLTFVLAQQSQAVPKRLWRRRLRFAERRSRFDQFGKIRFRQLSGGLTGELFPAAMAHLFAASGGPQEAC